VVAEKKYKKCCLPADQDKAAHRATQAQQQLESAGAESDLASTKHAFADVVAKLVEEDAAERQAVIDQVRDLIDDQRLDEAEAMSRQIETEHPDDHIGTELLAEVYVARGQSNTAADHYRRAVAFMDGLGPGEYCDCCRARMVNAIMRLDPDHPAPPLGLDPQ
jgi:predicted Zn-dependent protease